MQRAAFQHKRQVMNEVGNTGVDRQEQVRHFGVVTLFPDMVQAALSTGVVARGFSDGVLTLDLENPREHATDRHRTVDARPFGGGPGMVMTPGPVVDAVRALRQRLTSRTGRSVPVVCVGPQGRRFDQRIARRWSGGQGMIFLAGRYEGIDERVIDAVVDEEVSLGDFVLSGGEIAAVAMIDAVARLVPGVLGHVDSANEDSFGESGLLDHPHYTRPEQFEGVCVPEVLLSGDHARIARWRTRQAMDRTRARRPDLLDDPIGKP